MAQFDRIERNEIASININESSNDALLKKLFCYSRYIYVENATRLVGIISVGDFRSKFAMGNHVNTTFHSIPDGNNVIDAASEIYDTMGIKEIPVVNAKTELLYVLKKKENIINSFDFDWSLCDVQCIQDFFKDADNIYYFFEDNKIRGLRIFSASFLRIEKIDNINVCNVGDILIHNGYSEFDIRSFHIDEIYLSILSRSAVKRLASKGIQYYFFQTPVAWKLRKENKIFYKGKLSSQMNEKDLSPMYQDDVRGMRYWLSGDYNQVEFCESEGRYLPTNISSETYNVSDNQRLTVCQPKSYEHTIYVVGTCIVRGYGVSDELTIPSILQKILINENQSKYIIRNLGTGGGLNLYSDIRDFINILRTNLAKDDMVIHLGYNCWELAKSKVEFDDYYELSWLFNKRHEKRCFLNGSAHLTAYANRIIAEYIFNNICSDL